MYSDEIAGHYLEIVSGKATLKKCDREQFSSDVILTNSSTWYVMCYWHQCIMQWGYDRISHIGGVVMQITLYSLTWHKKITHLVLTLHKQNCSYWSKCVVYIHNLPKKTLNLSHSIYYLITINQTWSDSPSCGYVNKLTRLLHHCAIYCNICINCT